MPPTPPNGPTRSLQPYGMGVQVVRPMLPRPDLPQRDLTREYVAAGNLWWYRDAARRLPYAIDDLTADFGDDLYVRMLRDPQVNACGEIFKLGVIEDGVHLTTAVDDAADKDYDDAKKVTDHLSDMLENQEQPLDDTLHDLLDAAFMGNRVAEVKWEYGSGMQGRGKMLNVLDLKVKARESTAFVVDAYMNIIGLLGILPGMMTAGSSSQIIMANDPNLLPRSKFAVLTFRPRNNDPRGTSILRAAYDPWWRKRQILIEYMRYLTQFAGPSVIGFTPPADAAGPQADPLGNLVVDPNTGNMIPALTPEEQMLTTLLTWRNGLAAAFPNGSEVQVVQPTGNGEAFLKGLAQANIEITKAILTQQLATEEGEHMARAAAQVHQDVLATIIRQAKKSVVRMVIRDLLMRWLLWNLGPSAKHLCPKASLGQVAEEDKATTMNAISNLERAGFLHPSQYSGIDMMLGLPPRDVTQEFEQLLPMARTIPAPAGAQPPAPAPGAGASSPPPPSGANGGAPGLPPAPVVGPAPRIAVRAHSRGAAYRALGGRPAPQGDGAAA